jgi:hypothetical protein
MSDYRIEAATKEEWAERALRAEADLRKMALDYLAAEGQAAEAYQAQLTAEAKLDEALDWLSKVRQYAISWDDRYLVERSDDILAKLKARRKERIGDE